jgi:hypothetical protein
VLVGAGRDGEVEDCPDRKDHEAGNESTGHRNPPLRLVSSHRGTEISLPGVPNSQTISGPTGSRQPVF